MAHRPQPGDLDRDDAVRVRRDRSLEQIAGADKIGNEARLRKAVDARRFVDLLDATLVHYRDPMRQGERLGLGKDVRHQEVVVPAQRVERLGERDHAASSVESKSVNIAESIS